jgi:hypothetical protein
MSVEAMKRINVLIPDGDDFRALKVVQSLGISGKTNVFIITTRDSTVKYSRLCVPFYTSKNASNEDINVCMKCVLERYPIDAILPLSEKGISYIHDNDWLKKWNIAPIPNINTLNSVCNKWSLNNLLRDLRLDSPQSIIIKNKCDIDKIEEIKNYPVLIKPTHSEGGIGIVFVKDKESLHVQIAKELIYGGNSEYIVQEYIQGSIMSISLLCNYGKILAFEIHQPIDKAFKELTFSRMIEFITDSSLLEYCQELISRIKWSGVANMDFIKEKAGGKLFLLDFNPRFWGTLIGSTWAGVNFPYLACLSAMGISYPLPKYKNIKYYGLEKGQMLPFLFSNKGNKVDSIRNSSIYMFLLDPLPKIMNQLPAAIIRALSPSWSGKTGQVHK